MNIEEAWSKTIEAIGAKVGSQAFDLWFRPIKFVHQKDEAVVLEVPNKFFKEWIEDHYPGIISSTISELTKQEVAVRFRVIERNEDPALRKAEARQEKRRATLGNRGIYLNPKFTFDTFVVGASNQFAHAASRAVADSPGKAYNPLFIYGGVGLGKTHLMNAIGNKIIDQENSVNLLYAPAEQFTNEFVYSMRNDKMEEFKAKYRNLDVLIIDDIQFIAGKSGTQEEMFHTFNALYDTQKQIIFSSDRPPRDISPITERLRSRFGMGLIADIQPPDVETKMAILGKKSEMEGIELPEDVNFFLASRIKSNIRDLEACMIRLGAHSSLTGKVITIDMAKDVLKDLVYDEQKALTVEYVQKTVCEYFGLKVQDIKAKKRTRDIAFPRQVAMYLSKTLTESSLNEIGKNFGGKDHSTVIHACKLIEERRKSDDEFEKKIDYLIKKIKTQS
ncbi:MAG: chromosomal replication initiator protein DnaA [Nitrospiraceae bacterium]|nr:MAG: chromosomal replication initiator protein DnaA [Nitrospiraceae bacterium]